ncbi:hypothetical protein HK405_015318, partial [Cladochytrium tenue]
NPDEIKISIGDAVVILEAYDDAVVNPPITINPGKPIVAEPNETIIYRPSEAQKILPPYRSSNGLSKPPTAPHAPPLASLTAYSVKVHPRPASTALARNPYISTSSNGVPLSRADVFKKLDALNRARAIRAKVPANVGAIKIAIVGDSGIGKTSMVKSFTSAPEVVTSDSLPSQPFFSTTRILDIKASTIPAHTLSTGEDPMNITLVDTPGFGSQMDAIATIEPETDKVFERLERIPNLIRYLSSGSGAHGHIDVCVYGIL